MGAREVESTPLLIVALRMLIWRSWAHVRILKSLVLLLLLYVAFLHFHFWNYEDRDHHYYIVDGNPVAMAAVRQDTSSNSKVEMSMFHDKQQRDIHILYEAAALLQTEYGPGKLNLGDLTYHLNVLRTRTFPAKQRPDKCHNCFPYTFHNTLSPRDVCGGKGAVDILMIITTVPDAGAARQVIRETWASYSHNNTANVRYLFLLGGGWNLKQQQTIEDEHRIHGDILQDDFKDAYYNLSMKVIMGFRWCVRHCARAKFVMRTADDNFINVPEVVRFLHGNEKSLQRAQVGRAVRHLHVTRVRKYKWYISEKELPHSYYPDYIFGTAFLFSTSAVMEILDTTPNVPFFAIEDVYFGYVIKELGMKVVHVGGFGLEPDIERRRQLSAGLCPYKSRWFTLHEITSREMAMLWQQCVWTPAGGPAALPAYFNNWLQLRKAVV